MPFVLRLSSFVAVLLSACSPLATLPPPPTPAALHILATDLTTPLLLDLAEAYARAQTNIAVVPVLDPVESLSTALTAGDADLALTARPEPGLFATPLAYTRLEVVVHLDNTVGELSVEQVQALFAGDIADWAQLGAAPGPVQVVVPPPAFEAAGLFGPALMGEAPLSPSALIAPSWDAMRELLAADPFAFGYLPAPELSGPLRPVEQPEALRALIVAVALAEPSGPARDFLAWAQGEAGQSVVAGRYEPVE